MLAGVNQGLAVALCAVMLHGCSSSSAEDATEGPGIPGNQQASVADDGSVLLPPNNGVEPPLVNLPGENPEPLVVIGPEGDSNVMVDERRFPLDSALGDIWGVSNDHYKVNFTLTNGKFVLVPTEIDGVTYKLLVPAAATAVVFAEMYSPGETFSFVTYSHSPFGDGGGVLAGNAFFDHAFVGYDEDNSGEVENDERQAVIGGTIDFTGILPDIELHFSVSLENGQTAEGHYTGLFDFTDRQ